MPRSITLPTSTAALALAFAAFAGPALADTAGLNSMSFSTDPYFVPATVRVISTDKVKWDAIKPGAMNFTGNMSIDTKYPGMIWDVAVVLGECSDNGCAFMPAIWSTDVLDRDFFANETISFQSSLIGVSGTGITLGDQILARCNEKLQADGPTKAHTFTHQLPATFIADSDKDWGNVGNLLPEAEAGPWPHYPNEIDHTRTAMFDVNVICEPVVKPSADDLKHDLGEFKVEDVKLFLTTYHNQVPGSNPGTVCPAFKVTSRAETSKAGAVQMRIWRQKDGGPITSQLVDAWSSYDAAKNGYFATWQEFENVGTTSYFQFKTEIVGDAFAPFDGWKDITVHCTGAGGGGFASEPNDNNADLPKPKATWKGSVLVSDTAGKDKSCPRKGTVFFGVSRQAPGNFDYRISCSNGAYFEGSALGADQGSGAFEAYATHEISINKTRKIQCTLQEMTPAPVTVSVDSHDFTCANPAIDPPADDLADSPRPNLGKPEVKIPAFIVTPAPHCGDNQHIVKGKCVDKPSVSIFCKKGFVPKGKTCVRKPTVVEACATDERRVKGVCVKAPDVKPVKIKKPEVKPQRLKKPEIKPARVKKPEARPVKRLPKAAVAQPKLPGLQKKPRRIN
ncbi:MAG: hypothetical protein AB7I79_16080 [Rhizobiaceae bacterium]